MNTQTPTPTLPTTHIETQNRKSKMTPPPPPPSSPSATSPSSSASPAAANPSSPPTSPHVSPPTPSRRPTPPLPRPPVGPQEYRTRNLHPGTIIYLSTEDSIHTLDARLTAAGAPSTNSSSAPRKPPLHYHDENSEHPQFPEALKRGILPRPSSATSPTSSTNSATPASSSSIPSPPSSASKTPPTPPPSAASSTPPLPRPILPLLRPRPLPPLQIRPPPHPPPPPLPRLHRLHRPRPLRPPPRTRPPQSHPPPPPPNQKQSLRAPPLPGLHHHQPPPIENRKSKIENPQEAPTLTWDPDPLPQLPILSFSPSISEEALLRSQLDDAIDFLKTTLTEGPLPSAQLLKESRSPRHQPPHPLPRQIPPQHPLPPRSPHPANGSPYFRRTLPIRKILFSPRSKIDAFSAQCRIPTPLPNALRRPPPRAAWGMPHSRGARETMPIFTCFEHERFPSITSPALTTNSISSIASPPNTANPSSKLAATNSPHISPSSPPKFRATQRRNLLNQSEKNK